MKRYSTRLFTTLDQTEVAGLCALDNTPADEVRVADVEPVYVTKGWILWDDDNFGGYCPTLPQNEELSNSATALIGAINEADPGYIENGWATLLEVADIIGVETKQVHRPNARCPEASFRTDVWTLKMKDGSIKPLYVVTKGLIGKYTFKAFWSEKSADSCAAKH